MLSRFKSASILAMMIMAAAPAFAQGPGGGRGGRGFGGGFGGGFGRGNSPYALLAVPAVQEELALSDEQKTQSAVLVTAMREAARNNGPQQGLDRESLRNMSDEQRRERFAAMGKEMEERNAKLLAEYQPKFAEVLDEAQLQRLHQISWQSQGPRALRDPELAKALGLSQEQQDKIAAVFTENRGPGPGGNQGFRGRNDDNGGDREAQRAEFQARMAEMNAKVDHDVKGVLTDAQKTELNNLLGAQFDLSKLRRPEGERGPGGPGRGRRGNNN